MSVCHDATEFGPGAVLADLPPSSDEHGTRARAIHATVSCIARYGVAKTTVDDIARTAGLSRATLYRSFPGGRDELFSATLSAEVARYFARLQSRLESVSDAGIEEILVVGLSASSELLCEHEALAWLVANEPEVVVTHLAFDGLQVVMDTVARRFAPLLSPLLGEVQARRVVEWLTRLVVSYAGCRSEDLDASRLYPIDEELARRLVHQFVMPGIHVLQGATRS